MPQFPHTLRTDEGHSPAAHADGATMLNPFRVKAQEYDKLFFKNSRDIRLQPGWGQGKLGERREETREFEPTVRWPLRENRRTE